MESYKLTKAADLDFETIFEYGIENYGLGKATVYQKQLISRFIELVKQPLFYPSVDYIRQGYRRSVCGINSIYYRIEKNEILIVRILGKQDPHAELNQS